MTVGMTTCPRCLDQWGGLGTSHCAGCHNTFTTVTSFDKHRTGSHGYGTRACLHPAKAGLELAGRAYTCWGLPSTDWERE